MKTLILIAGFCIVINTHLFAQNDEDWHTRTYEVENFSELFIEGGYRIHLIQGDDSKVMVKASDSDVFDYLQVKEWGDELRIDIEPDKIEMDRIALYITFKTLEKLDIQGGVKLYTEGYLDLEDLDMYVAGGAKVEMELKADDLKIVGEGGVLFELDGIAKSLDVKLSGAGHVDAKGLKVKDASFRIEGVGTGSVHAVETLYAKIEGVGKVSYKGDPEVSKHIEGVGTVTRN